MNRVPRASIEFAKGMRRTFIRFALLHQRIRRLQKRAAQMDARGLDPDAIIEALVDLNLRLREVASTIEVTEEVRQCPHLRRLLEKLGKDEGLLRQFLKGPGR